MSIIRSRRVLFSLALAAVATVFLIAPFAFAQVDPPVPPVVPANPLQLLVGLSVLVGVMPEIVDGWMASKIADPKTLGFAVMGVGVLGGTLGGFFAQLGAGGSLRDAGIVFGTGTLVGIAKGLANWSKANAAKKGLATMASAATKVVAIALFCVVGPAVGLLGIVAATEGCTTQQAQAVTPPVADLAKCVAEGALAGDTIAQLVAKCGGDVPAIIGALFSSKEPAVKTTKAHAEARRTVALDAGDAQ